MRSLTPPRRRGQSPGSEHPEFRFWLVLAASITIGCGDVTIQGETGSGAGQDGLGGGGAGGGIGHSGGTGGGIVTLPPATDAGPTVTGPGRCGNGALEGREQCDDGNTESGDGCNKICQLESNHRCAEPGKPCENLAKCGNGVLTSDETCDDGNTVGGDGCSADCMTAENGYQCRVPGKPCTPKCGDGIRSGSEACDDGNTASDDGCSSLCKLEVGFKCDTSKSPNTCSGTVCPDGKKEGAEGCDDGNTVPFDGCSQECQIEPNCSGEACTSKCGDGIVLKEECDDGNAAGGDGCSADCKVEAGWTCTQPPLGDTMSVPIIYRDFKFKNPADFEASVTGSFEATLGIVKPDLDKDGKPVFTEIVNAHIASPESFGQWYRNTDGINHATASKLVLWANGKGAYVNRYGPNGEQWQVSATAYYCGVKGQELDDQPCTYQYQWTPEKPTNTKTDCQKMEDLGYKQIKCYLQNGTYMATYSAGGVDGNPLFFPIDKDPFSAGELKPAQVPGKPVGLYQVTELWPYDVDDDGNTLLHNFSFTSEVRYWFKYEAGKTYTLNFVGDDDVWVFINKKLAVDLGGIHTPVEGSITIDNTTAGGLNMKPDNVYEIAVFQAERQTTCSSYKLTLSGFNAALTSCVPTCGDGVTVADEECDCGNTTVQVPASCPGPNSDDSYGGCTTKCTWGGYCGDGIVNGPEECDNGKNNGTQYGSGGCTLGCTVSHYCGDGHLDTDRGEECDFGEKNGAKLDKNLEPSTDKDAQVYCDERCAVPPGVVF